jgi:hypothetical protein
VLKNQCIYHHNKVIMRYESLTVKGLDVNFQVEVAKKHGSRMLQESLNRRG